MLRCSLDYPTPKDNAPRTPSSRKKNKAKDSGKTSSPPKKTKAATSCGQNGTNSGDVVPVSPDAGQAEKMYTLLLKNTMTAYNNLLSAIQDDLGVDVSKMTKEQIKTMMTNINTRIEVHKASVKETMDMMAAYDSTSK